MPPPSRKSPLEPKTSPSEVWQESGKRSVVPDNDPNELIRESVVENVLESMPAGLMIVGKEGRVFQVNALLAAILGFSKDTLLEQGWSVLFIGHPENNEFNDAILDVIQEARVRESREVWYARPDGQWFFLKITSSFLRFGGDDWRLVVLVQDLTELHLMHQREKAALEEKRLAEQQRADSLNNLALSIAHQIRNPIMTIGGFAGLAAKHTDNPDKVAEYLRSVMESAQRLERMAAAVREYVSIVPGTLERLAVQDVLLGAVQRVRECAAHPERILEASDSLSPDWTIQADSGQVAAALDAILENAFESYGGAPDQDKIVTIEARANEDALVVLVVDKGRGISEQDTPFVRDPFFTTKAVGTGMGLAVAQRIMALHGGNLEITSSPGKGARVAMIFPRAWEQARD
ncbi:two-component system sensor histidine kinase NtrB [Desulfonatronum lacustre]|uniref:two-component system sensor histidine kinase NtrB n=1 Tax=Desulfonatronum lacustre TaxID=66849 RepID=UPI00048C5549|nr:ATP-binding protein [Desulfonatronum lacustre]